MTKNYIYPTLERVEIEAMSFKGLVVRIARLEEALKIMLISADCSWEEHNEGHDWREACEFARKVLGFGKD